jgi:hypothetical protein
MPLLSYSLLLFITIVNQFWNRAILNDEGPGEFFYIDYEIEQDVEKP